MTGPAAPFGPWSPSVGSVERIAQFRSLAALAALLVSSHHPLVAELRAAERFDRSSPTSGGRHERSA
jgi:hypothetical protein